MKETSSLTVLPDNPLLTVVLIHPVNVDMFGTLGIHQVPLFLLLLSQEIFG